MKVTKVRQITVRSYSSEEDLKKGENGQFLGSAITPAALRALPRVRHRPPNSVLGYFDEKGHSLTPEEAKRYLLGE